MAKSYNDWLFDLDEHLVARNVGVRSHNFDRAALDFGFTNGLAPEEFLSHPCSLREQVLEPVHVDRPEDLKPKRSVVIGTIVGLVLLIVLCVGVPRLLKLGHRHSGRHLVAGEHALDALVRLDAGSKAGTDPEAYSNLLSQARSATDTLSREFPHDTFQAKLKAILEHYILAEELWQATSDDPSPSRELPPVEEFWQRYPDGHIWFMGDHLLSVTPALNVIWAEGRKELESGKELL
jgi:hypothetical protein